MGHIPKTWCQLMMLELSFFWMSPTWTFTLHMKHLEFFWNVFEKHFISILNILLLEKWKLCKCFGWNILPLLMNRSKKPPLHSPFALHMLKFMIIFVPCVLYVILSGMEHSPNTRLDFASALFEAFYFENAFTLSSTFQVQIRK
jgi:hypothetical protein